MRRRLLRWLVCPLCQGELNLLVADWKHAQLSQGDYGVLDACVPIERSDEIEKDVTTGALVCKRCLVYYPVYHGIPRMLTYPTRVTQIHAQENVDWIAEHLSGFHPPRSVLPPGELTVLRNFSTEWEEYEWNGASYWNTTPENMLRCKRYELGLSKHKLKHKLVLEVGIGIGGTADALSRAEECELVGMDLGYSVDQARRYFGQNPRFHMVQTSVFALPFRPSTFDIVYSHGVLHHTYSTHAAFRHVARLPKCDGGMLYVWVYSHQQERATLLRRALMLVEGAVRPVLSHLPRFLQTFFLSPTLPLYVLYQNVYRRFRLGRRFAARYGLKEALHAARDRLTPPFAHRHTYEEVVEWFQTEMYKELELLRDEIRPEGVSETYPLNVGVRGFRS